MRCWRWAMPAGVRASWRWRLQANGWLNCPADAELIFNTSADLRYEMALRGIGIEPAMLSMDAGHA